MAPMKLHFLFMRYFSLFLPFFEETLPTKLILNCVNVLNLTNVIILFYILQLPLAFTNLFFLEKEMLFSYKKRSKKSCSGFGLEKVFGCDKSVCCQKEICHVVVFSSKFSTLYLLTRTPVIITPVS